MSDRYYHGRLDRQTSEDRLRVNGNVGAYLVRESERKVGSFVLSYLGSSGTINHFRITHVYGCYFIGGRKFDSLLDLINYYTCESDLLPNNQRLIHPVLAPKPITPQSKLFMAILPYTKLPQTDELSFKKGDILILQNDLGDSWYWCRHSQTGESGLAFAELLEEISSEIDPNELYPWFHANISKSQAVEILVKHGPGSFLCRPSDNSPGNYSLFYHVGSSVQRFRISRDDDNRYLMGGRCYESLGHIIDTYRVEQIVEGQHLKTAVASDSRTTQMNEASALSSMKALEIKNRSRDIYATLKASREASKKKQSSQVSGMLWMKKNELYKKWKLYHFVVNSRDKHLYYFEKAGQTKPKGLIDLTYSYIYDSHESLHDKLNCFQLVEKSLPCFSNFFFLHCDKSNAEYKHWVNCIKNLASVNQRTKTPAYHQNSTNDSNNNTSNTQFLSNDKHNRLSGDLIEHPLGQSIASDVSSYVDELRTVHITFVEAHSLRTSGRFVVSLNQTVKMCRTQVKTGPTAIFEDDGHFVLENLPRDISKITITLCNRGSKRSRDYEVADICFDLKKYSNSHQIDDWFELIGKYPPIREVNVWGCLRLKLHYISDLIMPSFEYSALEDLILDTNLEVITALENLHTHSDRSKLATALTNILRNKNAIPHLLKAMIEREINLESDTATLFRSSSLTTAIIECHFRTSCSSIIASTLYEPVRKIIENKISCELNPSRLESNNALQSKACENLQNLFDLLDEFVERIFSSVESYPKSVRYICGCLQRAVVKKWPQDTLAKTRVVSGWIFLRLICPAILNPTTLIVGCQEAPNEKAARNLLLVAKCLQSLSNLAECPKTSDSDYLSSIQLNNSTSNNNDTRSDSNPTAPIKAPVIKSAATKLMEPWMECVSPFILKNRTRLIRFIDELSDIDQYPFIDPISLNDLDKLSSPTRDLADIHTICESHRAKLDQLATTVASVKKLATICDILSKHRQHYLNLRV
ncbi:Ras GTPase-activating protein 1 [Fragariocoptes setiger]|uniref:Ras GTPase-activating protein 1 n=1 Tax=Fragariocoptes setiger TaxID=1670756 RepID=A0ABQ7S8U1_9ACAR|nr:Ras GTPase-activating protein 1 [Fragariocoptes setiger]